MESRKTQALHRIGKLKIVISLTASYLAVQVIAGLLTGSLALIADAGHMLTDVVGLTLSLLAISFSRRPATPQKTYGFYRMEILASLANSVILVLISTYILYEAYTRSMEPLQIQSFPMIIVATVGLGVNFVSMKLLRHTHGIEDDQENLNMKGAYLEVLSDTLGSIGVIGAGVVILTTGFYLADPLVSIGLALFILPRTWSLMKKSVHILMQGVPSGVSHEEVKKAILQVKGVTGVFDLHIWTITSGMNTLSAHVVILDPTKSQTILKEINSILEKRFKINDMTIQIETYHPQEGQFNSDELDQHPKDDFS